ncbi:MAG: alpha/beta hydrolase [Gemmatimonadaceae bacterium]|nr:alpha/beta hydrolase [Gemmatimonadaceae bacterium]
MTHLLRGLLLGATLAIAAPVHSQHATPAPGHAGPVAAPAAMARQTRLRTFAGVYRLAPGRDLAIGPFDELGGQLVMLDLGTLDIRVLHERDDSTFSVGTTLMAAAPLMATVVFHRDTKGRPASLTWRGAGGDSQTAPVVGRARTEQVEFRNGDVTLRGTLRIPDTPGAHPAVVLVHGSGPATRDVGYFNTVYDRMGVAVLSFDKRGAGASGGDWEVAGLNELAGDVVAAVKLLRTRSDIDAHHVGLDGSSQGGWVGVLAAKQAAVTLAPDAVAWLSVRVGSGTSVAETVLWERRGQYRRQGLTVAQSDSAVAFARAVYALAAAGAPWEASDSLARTVITTGWFRRVYPDGRRRDDRSWTFWRKNVAIDAMPTLRQLAIPVNWALGRADENVETRASAPLIAAALAASSSPDWAVHVLSADHSFIAGDPATPIGDVTRSRSVAGYWDALEAFTRRRLEDVKHIERLGGVGAK